MKNSKLPGFTLVLFCLSFFADAAYEISAETGEISIKTSLSSEWNPVTGSSKINIGDSLLLEDALDALIIISPQTKLLLSDSCMMFLGGTDMQVNIFLSKGQVFLLREGADDQVSVSITADNCTFIPLGTAAAVKTTKYGNPSVAVLRGSMRMSTTLGKSLDVQSGFFGTYDISSSSFKQGKLPPQATSKLEALENRIRQSSPQQAKESAAESVAESTQPAGEGQQLQEETPAPPTDQEAKLSPEPEKAGQTAAAPEKEKPEAPPAPAETQKEPEQKEKPKKVKKEAKKTIPPDKPEEAKKPKEESKEEKAEEEEKPSITKELSASYVTVDDEQWMRIAFSLDVPIWKFGVCFDLELFLDEKGMPSNKGWNFIDDPVEAIFRKIRYIRFNHEQDPVFIKFGGLDNVTFGYGFVVDRFTNLLNYPDEKLLGLQFYLNDISPIGVTLQTLIADFKDFRNEGGVLAGRLAIKPFKATEKPIIGGLSIGGLYATDLNQYAPARDWKPRPKSFFNADSLYVIARDSTDSAAIRRVETIPGATEYVPKDLDDMISIAGGDLTIPIITSKILNLDIYGQAAITLDNTNDDDNVDTKGWGFGAPGVSLKAGPFWSRLEYRHIVGEFYPSYFNAYYLNERLTRNPNMIKENTLKDDTLNGVFGEMGININDIIILSGTYQRLVDKNGTDAVFLDDFPLDQRFEATTSIGGLLLEKIPKLNKAEIFFYKRNIQRVVMNPNGYLNGELPEKDAFFEKTPNTYWGFRVGAEILAGASVTWETRYGWKFDNADNLVDDNQISISAGLSF